MAQTTLVWTAVPDGYDAGRPRVAVFVQPRLTGTPGENTLASYPAFTSAASPWTARLRQIPFQVWIDGQVRPAEAVFDPGMSDALFTALFPASLPVRTYATEDLRGRSVRTYPVGVVMDFLDAEYGKIAAEPPRVTTQETAERPDKGSGAIRPAVLPAIGALGSAGSVAAIDAALARRFTAAPVQSVTSGVAAATGDPGLRTAQGARAFTTADLAAVAQQANATREAVAFRMLERYYTPTAHERTARAGAFAPSAPDVDVHTVHGGLGDTPVLLRRCGFAFTLLLPAGALPASGTLRVLPGAGAPGTQACPPTRYTATAERFRPAPRTGSTFVTASGMLPLSASGAPAASGSSGAAPGGGTPAGAAPVGGTVQTGGLQTGGIGAGALNAGVALFGSPYRIAQGDPDGTGLKATSSVRNRAGQGNTTDDETLYETGLLAAQRSAGLGVYRTDRGAHLAVSVQRTADFEAAVRTGLWAPAPPAPGPQAWPLFADDLVAGYLVEVYDETAGAWFSLCRREGRYAPDGLAPFVETDDGAVAVSAVAVTPAADPEKLLRAHDALFQWDGWSLVAPRPGLSLVPDDDGATSPAVAREHEVGAVAGRYERLARPVRVKGNNVHVQTAFKPVGGTLPRLRFGRRYRIRARAVSLAGTVSPPDDAHASPLVAFARFEPLEPPTVALRRPLSEGESAERLVIRSDPGAPTPADPAQYAARADVLAATQKTIYDHFEPTCERHLVPPSATPETAERHGRFDTGPWTDASRRDALLNVVAKASGTLLDPLVVDVQTGQKTIPQPGLALVASDGSAPPALGSRTPGDPLPNGVYAVYNTDEIVVPYLPDPLARGVVFQNVPGTPGPLLVPFDVTFPAARPVRIRLNGTATGTLRGPGLGGLGPVQTAPLPGRRPAHRTLAERTDPTLFAPAGTGPRVLDVALPPAAVVEVFYSTAPKTPGTADTASTVRVDLPDKHDLFGPRRQAVPFAASTAALDRAVGGGLHEVVSPVRRLTLVHAVQRPLAPAQFDGLAVVRPAETGHPAGAGQTHVDLSGGVRYHLASTGRLDLEATWLEPVDDVAAPAPRDGQDLREIDGRSGRVAEVDVEPYTAARQPPGGLTVSGATARMGLTGAGGFTQVRHEFGDTKRRTVSYRADAATRFRDYFPAEITQTPANLTRTGDVSQIVVPSSARPAAPDVRYVVPTFRWQTEPLADGLLRRRCGGGLRVWLGRPWYSSGEGEQLAVLIGQGYDNANPKTAEVFDRYRSRWGLDPFWGGTALGEMPAEALLNRTGVKDNLSIPDSSKMRVFGVAHDVHFDAARRLWYCDIELDTGAAYMPFVKLALARYQPESVAETHLSSVVVADFVQTLPTRTAAARRVQSGAAVEVSVGGPMGNSAAAAVLQGDAQLTENNVRATVFTATVERQSAPGAAWMAAPGVEPVTLVAESMTTLADVVLRATIRLPEPLRASGTRLRVAVAEVEVHSADAPQGAGAVPAGRLVYADTLELP